jgi:predicted ArsR family transcriptional regulator
MTSVVKVQDVIDEMEAVSGEHHAYLNRQTGELVTITDEEICAVEEERDLANYAAWQQEAIQKTSQVLDSDDYLPLPNKFDIHEYSIVEQFCIQIEDAELSNELLFQGIVN